MARTIDNYLAKVEVDFFWDHRDQKVENEIGHIFATTNYAQLRLVFARKPIGMTIRQRLFGVQESTFKVGSKFIKDFSEGGAIQISSARYNITLVFTPFCKVWKQTLVSKRFLKERRWLLLSFSDLLRCIEKQRKGRESEQPKEKEERANREGGKGGRKAAAISPRLQGEACD